MESIDVRAGRISVVATVASTQQAHTLTLALGQTPSPQFAWKLLQPQITADRTAQGGERVRVVLTFDPVHLGTPPAPPTTAARQSGPRHEGRDEPHPVQPTEGSP